MSSGAAEMPERHFSHSLLRYVSLLLFMQTIEVRFKGNRKALHKWSHEDEPLRMQEAVIVETDRGLDLGRVSAVGDAAAKKCGSCATGCGVPDTPPPPMRIVVRRASQEEIRTSNELRKSEEDVRRKVIEKVRQHQLTMKVSDAEWQWDRNKLTVYFTAEKRVDFRSLVRDLAGLFRTRIELRQIGVRDEAARLSGIGRCGREYCCSTWLTELSPVSLSLAKDQHLSLNPQQISGGCGRLLCCLKYEHDFYVAARKRFPKEGRALQTALGQERVVAVDIFRERVFLRSEEHGPRIISLVQLREEVEPLPGVRPAVETRPAEPARPVPESAAPAPDAPRTDRPPRSRRRRGRRRRGGGGRGGNLGGPDDE
ncbi:MAG: stage 0 sporulation family protein [Gemmatimonadales bacterium]